MCAVKISFVVVLKNTEMQNRLVCSDCHS